MNEPAFAIKIAFALIRRFNPKRDRLQTARLPRGADPSIGTIADVLADGTIRYSQLLDRLIAHGSTVKPNKMEREVLMCARLGVLSHCRGIPAHAAANETVNLLPRGHKARGLVNAIVRRATETVAVRELTSSERTDLLALGPATTELISPRRLPLASRWLLEGEIDLFPVEERDRWMMLAGLPAWLWDTLAETLDDSELKQVCLSAAEEPGVWFRVTAGNPEAGRAALLANGCELGWGVADPVSGRQPNCAMAPSDRVPALLNCDAFRNGWLTVQDPAAQLPAQLLGAKPGWRVADFCAAPGGKTAQLAEAVAPTGNVIAVDDDHERLLKVRETISRLGLKGVNGVCGDARSVELPNCGKFDAVLVDAPCSNTGVLGRRVEVRHRLTPADLTELPEIQLGILANAARHLRPGGLLAYSTCSLLDPENGALVRRFLEDQGGEKSGWRMLDERLTLPRAGLHDGGYVAILRSPER